MSFYLNARSTPRQFRPMLASFLQRPGLSFADALPEETIQKAFNQEHVRFAEDEDVNPLSCSQARRRRKPSSIETCGS